MIFNHIAKVYVTCFFMFVQFYNEIINFLSFNQKLRKLRREMNISIAYSEISPEFPNSHPLGFLKEFKKLSATIIESYLTITRNLNSNHPTDRLRALRLLAENIQYSQTLKMPLNTARVQLAIMKQVVFQSDNKRKQLEFLRDFEVASFGHPRAIKKFLNKLDIIEVPETGEELRNLKMGWDFHVHDNSSYGRKSPGQLIIDAFIKGISELTIAYNNLKREDAIIEALEAGKILGIRVNIAIEFSAITNNKLFHFMYILPEFASKKKQFEKFINHRSEHFNAFLWELEENQKKREQNIRSLIYHFNTNHLPEINKGYEKGSIYYLEELPYNENIEFQHNRIASRRQLGELLYPKLKAVLAKRAMKITASKKFAQTANHLFSKHEKDVINEQFRVIRNEYRQLSPVIVWLEYFSEKSIIVEPNAASQLNEIYQLAKNANGLIKFIQPLEHGLEEAINLIINNFNFISHTEIYNLYDSIQANSKDIELFSAFIKLLNENDYTLLKKFLELHKIKYNSLILRNLVSSIPRKKIIPSIGSDATGRSLLVPGMGFLFTNRLAKYQRKHFINKHLKIPPIISHLAYQQSTAPKVKIKKTENPQIICLGRAELERNNLLGDEKHDTVISIQKTWEYLNPAIKNALLICIGFLPAFYIIGWKYALLWLSITGFRNMFVDWISWRGLSPKTWHIKDINWTNLAQSLFWTGFSVPILGFVKTNFDIFWTAEPTGNLYEYTKFFFINSTNGLYLATHNYIRGFDKNTIRGNFFRSILAFPMAALFSPIGNMLLIPSIVQAKFWSDFVAAIIEGTAKYKITLNHKERVVKTILPNLENEEEEIEIPAVLDLIYLMQNSRRAKTALRRHCFQQPSKKQLVTNFFKLRKFKKKPKPAYFSLLKWFADSESFQKICDFIIAKYNREQSLFLINLVSKNFYSTKILIEKWK